MATRIVFAAAGGEKPLSVYVEEEPAAVSNRFQGTPAGQPTELTGARGTRGKIYVNAATIAYWEQAASGSASFQ